MTRNRSIKAGLSSKLVPIIILYAAAALVLAFKFIPTQSQALRLEANLAQMEQTRDSLLLIAGQEPALQAKQQALEEKLISLKQKVPSQYDLAEILRIFKEEAASSALNIDSLDHLPLKTEKDQPWGQIQLRLRAEGDHSVLAYLLQIQDLLPTFRINDLILNSIGGGLFTLEVQGDLWVFVVENAGASPWVASESLKTEGALLKADSFGLPFKTVSEFLSDKIKVLGIVQAPQGSSALVQKDGKRQSLKVGERWEEALVVKITREEVWLDVQGVSIKLIIGG